MDHTKAKKKKKLFPLADAQQPQISLSATQHAELRAVALKAAQIAISEGHAWGRTNVDEATARGWKSLSSLPHSTWLVKSTKDKRSRSLKRKNGDASLTGTCFMAHSQVPNLTLEDVMAGIYSPTTQEMRMLMARKWDKYFLDTCVMQTLETATTDDPFWYLGIKWIALRSPVKKLVSNREFAMLEHTGTHVAENGQKLLYRVLQSVNLTNYGGKKSYFGLTRGVVEAAWVYWIDEYPDRQSDQEVENIASGNANQQEPSSTTIVNLCAKGRVHLKGALPLWVILKLVKRFWRSENSLQQKSALKFGSNALVPSGHVDEEYEQEDDDRGWSERTTERLLGDDRDWLPPLEMAAQWVDDKDRHACAVCERKFRRMRRLRHHCRACGEVVCRYCTSRRKLYLRPMTDRINQAPAWVYNGTDVTELENQTEKETASNSRLIGVGRVCHRCTNSQAITQKASIDAGCSLSSSSIASMPVKVDEKGNGDKCIDNTIDALTTTKAEDKAKSHGDSKVNHVTLESDSEVEDDEEYDDDDDDETPVNSRRNGSEYVSSEDAQSIISSRDGSFTLSEMAAIQDYERSQLNSQVSTGERSISEIDDDDEGEVEFNPQELNTDLLPTRGGHAESMSAFNPDSLFEIKDHNTAIEISIFDRIRKLHEDVLNRQLVNSPLGSPLSALDSGSSSTTSSNSTPAASSRGSTKFFDSSENDLRFSQRRSQTEAVLASFTKVENAIADQAYLLLRIEQERAKLQASASNT